MKAKIMRVPISMKLLIIITLMKKIAMTSKTNLITKVMKTESILTLYTISQERTDASREAEGRMMEDADDKDDSRSDVNVTDYPNKRLTKFFCKKGNSITFLFLKTWENSKEYHLTDVTARKKTANYVHVALLCW
jgi:hypothetical protein